MLLFLNKCESIFSIWKLFSNHKYLNLSLVQFNCLSGFNFYFQWNQIILVDVSIKGYKWIKYIMRDRFEKSLI